MVSDPQTDDSTPEEKAAIRAFADGLPAKKVDWASLSDSAIGLEHDGDPEPRHGNRGLGWYQCTCGRFAKFIRWQNTGAPGWERGYLVDCKRCGEVLVY